jgi:hypothetical protein
MRPDQWANGFAGSASLDLNQRQFDVDRLHSKLGVSHGNRSGYRLRLERDCDRVFEIFKHHGSNGFERGWEPLRRATLI